MNRGYERGVTHVTGRTRRYFVVYGIIVVASVGVLFVRVPKSFLPDEDQGILFVQVTAARQAQRVNSREARRSNEARDYSSSRMRKIS